MSESDAVAFKKIDKTKRIGRWYFGGLASAGAACCTHPLDLLKVHLQTQQMEKVRIGTLVSRILKSDGIMGLYNGLSASLGRQLTYSLARFAIYETIKKELTKDGKFMPFYQKVLSASIAGFTGGIVGTPCDLVNVSYKHVFDGLYQVVRYEGVPKLFSGASMASSRAVLVTVGQGAIATYLTQPVDVMKTRVMNAKPGQYSSLMACALDIAKNGPMGFFKGFSPAFVRLAPQTILTFIFFEQIRMNFGDDPK
ncbi:hypothetical protein KUTeg_003819 [Tegillarca granosa]|uniref:Mitochondrial dicarboxylate carrier n=1 Tax=Tegillarca granosa TaxID=220873 RepID=A0ABQ9FNA2_TEGGR|nr:hypothetical protein KUTeg_003819 [Tegillarca granosa]